MYPFNGDAERWSGNDKGQKDGENAPLKPGEGMKTSGSNVV